MLSIFRISLYVNVSGIQQFWARFSTLLTSLVNSSATKPEKSITSTTTKVLHFRVDVRLATSTYHIINGVINSFWIRPMIDGISSAIRRSRPFARRLNAVVEARKERAREFYWNKETFLVSLLASLRRSRIALRTPPAPPSITSSPFPFQLAKIEANEEGRPWG